MKAIENFNKSDSMYLLTMHFPALKENKDIIAGDWHLLNFCLEPFNYPEPILLINETTSVKAKALWKLTDLQH